MERSILKLPVSSLRRSLEFLDFKDLIVLRSVCKHFHHVSSSTSVLNIGSDIIVRPGGIRHFKRLLSRLSHLEELCVDGFNTMTDMMLETILMQLSCVSRLRLNGCVCLELPLSINRLSHLESLELTGCTHIHDDFFTTILLQMKTLRRLVLRETSITNVTLGFRHLTHLHISFLGVRPRLRPCEDDIDLEHLMCDDDGCDNYQLKTLILEMPKKIREEDLLMHLITHCPYLERLSLYNCVDSFPDHLEEIIQNCTWLKHLSVACCARQITPLELPYIRFSDPNLESLVLKGMPCFVDETLIRLAHCFPNLKKLHMSGCSLNSPHFSWENLESLRLERGSLLRRICIRSEKLKHLEIVRLEEFAAVPIVEWDDSEVRHSEESERGMEGVKVRKMEHLVLSNLMCLTSVTFNAPTRHLCITSCDQLAELDPSCEVSALSSISVIECRSLPTDVLFDFCRGCPRLERLYLSTIRKMETFSLRSETLQQVVLHSCPHLSFEKLQSVIDDCRLLRQLFVHDCSELSEVRLRVHAHQHNLLLAFNACVSIHSLEISIETNDEVNGEEMKVDGVDSLDSLDALDESDAECGGEIGERWRGKHGKKMPLERNGIACEMMISVQSCISLHTIGINATPGCFGGTLAVYNCPYLQFINGAESAFRTENTCQTPTTHLSQVQVDFDG